MRAIGDCGADDWADEDWVGVRFKHFVVGGMQRAWVTNPGPSTYPRLVGFEPTPLSIVGGTLYPIELQPQVEKIS